MLGRILALATAFP